MNSEILLNSVHISTIFGFLPVAIMLWNLNNLKKRTFGWAILGYFLTLFLSGLLNYISARLFNSIYPVCHVFLIFKAYFVYLLFRNEFSNTKFKRIAIIFLFITVSSEIFEFISKGGFQANNDLTFPLFNLIFILQYFLYLVDALKNRPTVIYDPKGSFLILSITYFYSISQFFFSLIREDIRFLMHKNQYAMLIWCLFIWVYIIYLLFSSYILWRNLRTQHLRLKMN
jgi:hypothetical protein